MPINKTELMAIEWLKQQGYKENEVIKNSNTSPDFICTDGKRYEVKFLYGKRLLFSAIQSKILHDEDIILVFDRDKFVLKFFWKDRDKTPLSIDVMKPLEITTIQLFKQTRENLRKQRIAKLETYDEIINRLLKEASDKQNGTP